jgi:hypothetical protein
MWQKEGWWSYVYRSWASVDIFFGPQNPEAVDVYTAASKGFGKPAGKSPVKAAKTFSVARTSELNRNQRSML